MQYCIIQIYRLQKTTNLMAKHIAKSHFLGSRGVTQTNCYITEAASCFRNTNHKTKFNRSKSSNLSYTFTHNLTEICRKPFLSEKYLRTEGMGDS